jgi:hypothetical protein
MTGKVRSPAQFARHNRRAGEGCYIGRVLVDPNADLIDVKTRKPRKLTTEERSEQIARQHRQREDARVLFQGKATHRQRALVGALQAATPGEIEEIRRLLGVTHAGE